VVDDIAHIIDALQSAADAEGARPMELEPSDIPLTKL
jgi:hypothetical protein